jgi:hypothetical protein
VKNYVGKSYKVDFRYVSGITELIMHLCKLRLGCNTNKAILSVILWMFLAAGCSVLGRTDVPTPFPEDFIETAIKLTLEAGGLSTSAAILNPSTPEATETPTADNPSSDPDQPENTPDQSGEGTNLNPHPTDTATPLPATTLDSPQQIYLKQSFRSPVRDPCQKSALY